MPSRNQDLFVKIAIAVTTAAFGLAPLLGAPYVWGINHLAYLPAVWWWLYGIAAAAILFLLVAPERLARLDTAATHLHDLLWGRSFIPRLIAAAATILLGWLLRAKVHLLGDGLQWLSELGKGEIYLHKWAEYGSLWLVRVMQSALGGHTPETAETVFALLSALSGGVVVWTGIHLAKRLVEGTLPRLFALCSILLSGTALMYFGYVEFYPLLWAALFAFLAASLRTLDTGRGLWLVILSFLAAVAIHVQALVLLPAAALPIVWSFRGRILRRVAWGLYALLGATALAVVIWLYAARLDLRLLLLPLFGGRPPAEDYSVFSAIHLIDLINLALLIFPGLLAILAVRLPGRNAEPARQRGAFLRIAAAFSLVFLLLYGAAITMARDWDIMALGLLAPILLLLSRLPRGDRNALTARTVAAYALVCALGAGSYVAANLREDSATTRFESLLNERNRGSWVLYAS